jgi:hypothetical protein
MEQQEQHFEWSEHPDLAVPGHILEGAERGTLSSEFTGLHVSLSIQRLPSGHATHFHSHLGDTLLRVYEKAAEALHEPLLPPKPHMPLDLLRYRTKHHEWHAPTSCLDTPLWEALAEGMTRHLGIDYQLIVRVNAKWGIASSPHTTPRALLTEFGFDAAQFSLYRHDGSEPLPPDVPLHLRRGERFEAQKDGRYGGTASPSLVPRGLQTIEDDIELLKLNGEPLSLLSHGQQRFVEVLIPIPSPPWSSSSARILIAVPSNYPAGGLDAFYVAPGITINGTIDRAQPAQPLPGKQWNLISWHYSAKRPWNPRLDDLQSHIAHCRGFFLRRGVVAE